MNLTAQRQELMGIMVEGCQGKGESIITGVVDIKTAAGINSAKSVYKLVNFVVIS